MATRDKNAWALKVLALVKAGNLPAALAQTQVAPTSGDIVRLQALLAGWQCQVLAARDLEDAIVHADAQCPDLLLLDYHLDGGHNGLAPPAPLALIDPPPRHEPHPHHHPERGL